MKAVSETLERGRVDVLLFALAFLFLLLGVLSGYLVGSYLEKQNRSVHQYAQLVYNTCKAQEKTLTQANSQRARRDCEYLLQAAEQQK